MLILSRHPNERIVINHGEIILTVIAIRGDMVRIGIDAPKHIQVHREEIQVEIDRERNRPDGPRP